VDNIQIAAQAIASEEELSTIKLDSHQTVHAYILHF
jgi:hypothetical protein